MLTRRNFTLAGLGCAIAACSPGTQSGGDSSTQPALRSGLVESARREGRLRIDAATGLSDVDNLLGSFRSKYPGIEVEYRRIESFDLYDAFLDEVNSGKATADILVSSSMDQQFKLVNDGYALAYSSTQKSYLPERAVWKDQAYAVTAEPIVFAYNRELMPPEDVPRSHHELTELLRNKPEAYRGKVTTYDPERSGPGYLYFAHDLQLSRDTLDLVRALGKTGPSLVLTGADALSGLVDGRYLLAYNMVSSHAFVRQKQDSRIGIIFPSDYTLVMSRIAFVSRLAEHPDAGKLFLDFLLSEAGQEQMAHQFMTPIRRGIAMPELAPSPEVLQPIHFGPSLLANLDEFRRRSVLKQWRRALKS